METGQKLWHHFCTMWWAYLDWVLWRLVIAFLEPTQSLKYPEQPISYSPITFFFNSQIKIPIDNCRIVCDTTENRYWISVHTALPPTWNRLMHPILDEENVSRSSLVTGWRSPVILDREQMSVSALSGRTGQARCLPASASQAVPFKPECRSFNFQSTWKSFKHSRNSILGVWGFSF